MTEVYGVAMSPKSRAKVNNNSYKNSSCPQVLASFIFLFILTILQNITFLVNDLVCKCPEQHKHHHQQHLFYISQNPQPYSPRHTITINTNRRSQLISLTILDNNSNSLTAHTSEMAHHISSPNPWTITPSRKSQSSVLDIV